MKFLNNRKTAWAVLGVSILVSIFGFGGGSLAREQNNIAIVYEEGVDPTLAVRFSIDAYMENCAVYARTMAEEYRLHIDLDSESATDVLALADRVESEENTALRAEAYRQLYAAVESLYSDFHAADLSQADQSDFSKAYTNFQSEVNKVGYDDYNGLARQFNKKIDTFPASLISEIWGIDTLDTY